MTAAFEFDRALFPLVVSRFVGHPKTPDYEAFMGALNAELERRTPFVHLLDSTQQSGGADALDRRRLAAWVQDERLRDLARHKLGDALVIRSAIVRGALTAVTWVMPPPSPTKAFERLADAEPFLRERCASAGLVLPEAAIRFLRSDGRAR